MSAADLNNFLEALDAVKKDYTCGVCGELCKNPVVLTKCFHMVCSGHAKLTKCPNCKIPLEEKSSFVDNSIQSCIESAAELSKIFEKFRPKEKAINIDKSVKNNETKKSSLDQSASKPFSEKTNTHAELSETIASNYSVKINKTNEKRNNKGETALHIACRLGKIERVSELLTLGANTNTKDNAGWTPLHEVVQNGKMELVKLLLQYNTLINVPGPSNETPLHEAIRFNQPKIAEELVKNGADINARNCKGETPYQLASNDMKNKLLAASENMLHTQSINISHIAALYKELELDDIHVYCVSQQRAVQSKLKSLTKHHTNLTNEIKFTRKTTHLIIDTGDDGVNVLTLDILQAIVSKIWIITSDWILNSTEDKLEPFATYEAKSIGTKSSNGPRNARYNKYKQLPGIFDGCHFYFHNFNMKYEISKSLVLNKASLTKLVTDAGGKVLRRVPNPELIPENEQLVPYHAKKGSKLWNCSHYIIFKDMYEPMYNMQHLKALPIGWLLECIEKYELCEPW